MQQKEIFKQKGDDIDALIQARTLDNHPEHFLPLVKELDLDKFLLNLDQHELKFLTLIGVNRFLNFVEAAHCSELTAEERRMGAAATILISCLATKSATSMRQYNPTYSTVIPVFLYKNTNLDAPLAGHFTDDEIAKIKTIVKYFYVAHPTAVTMKRNRIAMYMRDACLQFVNSNNTNIYKFIEGIGPVRREAFDVDFSFDVDMLSGGGVDFNALLKSIRSPYTLSAVTQWGTAKNFIRNSVQNMKNLLAMDDGPSGFAAYL